MTTKPIRYDKGWKADFRFPANVRHRKLFPFLIYGETPTAAQAWIESIVNAAADKIPRSDIESIVREYLNHKQKIGQAKPTTIYADNIRLKIWLAFCRQAGIKQLRRFDTEAMRKFQLYYFSNGPFHAANRRRLDYNPKATWAKYQSILSAFFNWCLKRKLVSINPAIDPEFKVKAERRAPAIFTPAELSTLLDWLDDHYDNPIVPTFFRFLAYTGCRPGEAWGAKWSQVGPDVIRFEKTKTGKDRSVPIRPELTSALNQLVPNRTSLIFDNGRGQPYYQESAWWKILRTALLATGLYQPGQKRNLYTFRHTFGASLARAGVNPFLLMELMGHDRIETTMVYCQHFFNADRTAAIAKLDY